MMGCNIPRPWKRPPTPPIYEPPEMPKTAPAKMHDQPFGSRTNAALNDGSNEWIKARDRAIIDAFDQFHQVAHDLTYHDTDLDKPIERPLNCPNCCAPIAGPFCEYCGTVFEQSFSVLTTTDNEQIVIPIYIGGEQIDKVVKQNRTQLRSENPAANVDAPPLPIKKER